jgi:hypothetical protein
VGAQQVTSETFNLRLLCRSKNAKRSVHGPESKKKSCACQVDLDQPSLFYHCPEACAGIAEANNFDKDFGF